MFENDRRVYSRRAFLGGAAGLGAGLLVGCGSETHQETPPTEVTKKIVVPKEILDFYQEIDAFPAVSFNVLQTSLKKINIVNYTSLQLNQDFVKEAYMYLERKAVTQTKSAYVKPDTKEVIPFLILPNQRRDQNIFIVPQGAPRSSWDPFDADAVTVTLNDTSKPYLTRISLSTPDPQHPYFNTQEKILQAMFATEACNAVMDVQANNPRNATIMQEVICNSLGSAMALKQQERLSFESYTIFLKTNVIPTPIGDLPFISLTPDEYAQLPSRK